MDQSQVAKMYLNLIYLPLLSLSNRKYGQLWQKSSTTFLATLKCRQDSAVKCSFADWLFTTVVLYQSVRAVIASICSATNFNAYFEYDSVVATLARQGAFDTVSGLFTSTVFLFLLFLDYLILWKMPPGILNMAYELVITNRRHFFTLNDHLKPCALKRWRPFESIRQFGQSMAPVWNADKVKFSCPLVIFTSLSPVERARFVLFSYAYEYVSSLVVLFALFSVFLGMVLRNFLQIVCIYSTRQSVYALLDLLSIQYIALRSLPNLAFLAQVATFLGYAFYRRLLTIEKILSRSLISARLWHLNTCVLAVRLAFCRREHWHLLETSIFLNNTIVSPLFFLGILCNTSINVYFVFRLLFSPVPAFLGEQLWMFFVAFMQALVCLCAVSLLLQMDKYLYLSRERPYQLQPFLKGSTAVRSKLKLSSYYECLTSPAAFHFTVGPIGRITRRTVFEFTFTYSAFLMFTISRHLN